MCIDGVSMADLDIWSDRAEYGGGMDFVLWAYRVYRVFNDQWENAGYFDALNQSLPFAKLMNTIWLLEWGLSDDHEHQWHSTLDYRRAGRAVSSRAHDQIHYDCGGNLGNGAVSRANYGVFGEGNIELGCPLFDVLSYYSNPGLRAGALIHEGWHHWAHKYNRNTSHLDGPVGFCKFGDGGCDWYYWHGIGEFEFGDMWQYSIDRDGTSHRYHKPFQTEVEYLCDLAEYPASWVPASVTILARAEANELLCTRFGNAVGYRCGDPRPW